MKDRNQMKVKRHMKKRRNKRYRGWTEALNL